MPMRDNFKNDPEDYLEIGPHGGPKFSMHVWSHELIPLARRVLKLAHVKNVRVSFTAQERPTYLLRVLCCPITPKGWLFAILNRAGPSKLIIGKDIRTQRVFQLDTLEAIWEYVRDATRRNEDDTGGTAHASKQRLQAVHGTTQGPGRLPELAGSAAGQDA